MGRARSSLSGPCGRHLLVVFLLVSSSSTASSHNWRNGQTGGQKDSERKSDPRSSFSMR